LNFSEQDGILIALKFEYIALQWVVLILKPLEMRSSNIFAQNLKPEQKSIQNLTTEQSFD